MAENFKDNLRSEASDITRKALREDPEEFIRGFLNVLDQTGGDWDFVAEVKAGKKPGAALVSVFSH